MKTSELTGPALDWAVAKCEGEDISIVIVDGEAQVWLNEDIYDNYNGQGGYTGRDGTPRFLRNGKPVGLWGSPLPSYLDWAIAGPIIEREEMCLQKVGLFGEDEEFGPWEASGAGNSGYGPTPLIAAMRCYCSSKLGSDVEIPEELR